TLDIRSLPDENMVALVDQLRKVIDDPAVQVVDLPGAIRPGAPPSRADTELFQLLEAGAQRLYDVPTVPIMLTGGTDMAQVREGGVQCYGIGPMTDSEEGPKGFGAHSDQERILEEALHQLVRFYADVVMNLAKAR